MTTTRTIAALVSAFLTVCAISKASAADDYPNKPINFVVPFSAGGSTDTNARFLAGFLKDKLGQPVIIENKPGAGSIIGAEHVVNAKPDGYTFLYGSNSNLVTFEYVTTKPSYNPRTGLLPFHGLLIAPPTLMARTDAPFKTVPELVAYAKANPGKINYATPGYNSSPHLAMELFMGEAGITMTHIPYKGESLAGADMLKGLVDIIFVYPKPFEGLIESGKLRLLAVPGTERLPNQKDVPTFAELGLPGVIYGNWAMMTLPPGTPAPIVAKLTDAFDKVLKEPEVVKFFADQGATIMPLTGKAIADFLDSERVRIKGIVARANIKPQ
jgi:tripartite-type tricarboxylate transporter receptor subunit TctC